MHDDQPIAPAALGYRFHSVEQKIQDDLLQLHMVAMHDGRLRIDIERDGDVADDCITAHELYHTAKLVEIEQNILELILLEQVAQVLDNLSSALDVLDDVNQDVAELVERGGVASRNRRAAWALARIPASGWFSSWASEAVMAPIVETRVQCASSWRLRWASISARFRSVMSVCAITAPSPDRPSGTTDIANQRSPSAIRLAYSDANSGCNPSSTASTPARVSAVWGVSGRMACRKTSR